MQDAPMLSHIGRFNRGVVQDGQITNSYIKDYSVRRDCLIPPMLEDPEKLHYDCFSSFDLCVLRNKSKYKKTNYMTNHTP